MTRTRAATLTTVAVLTGLTFWAIPRSTELDRMKRERFSILDAKHHGRPVDRKIPREELMPRSGLSAGDLTTALRAAAARRDESGRRRANNRGRNAFVNDPCLDPPPDAPFPINFLRTVQSETELAVLNAVRRGDGDGARRGGEDDDRDDGRRTGSRDDDDGDDDDGDDDDGDDDDGDDDENDDNDGRVASSGRLMVAGYNDSYGFDDNRQGLSGFSYSTDGGKRWIDASGLPPLVPSGAPGGTLGSDTYFGDPVVVVHHRTKLFYYSSLYQNAAGAFTVSVNRGRFKIAPRQVPLESHANTRCEGNSAMHGVPDEPAFVRERIIWDPPVEAVLPIPGGDGTPGTDDDDFLDKEWLYVDQKTGFLYLTYTRFGADGSTPIEMVRSFDQGQTWTLPSVVVPNLLDTFNQATMPVVTPTGRVVVTWLARTFELSPTLPEVQQRIEAAFSDNCGTPAPCVFGQPVVVATVDPQGEPRGYNRGRLTILNAPYIAVDKGRDDGIDTRAERARRGFGDVYITYFDGLTKLPQTIPPDDELPAECLPPNVLSQSRCNPFARVANILVSRSTNDSTTYRSPVKVNDDAGNTSHVFPSVQVNENGEIFVTWQDRRLDRARNLATDVWGDLSDRRVRSLGRDFRITTVSSDWITREDMVPDYGDYNSSEVIDFRDFISIWADGRFPTPAPLTPMPNGGFTRPADQAATPDSMSAIIRR